MWGIPEHMSKDAYADLSQASEKVQLDYTPSYVSPGIVLEVWDYYNQVSVHLRALSVFVALQVGFSARSLWRTASHLHISRCRNRYLNLGSGSAVWISGTQNFN